MASDMLDIKLFGKEYRVACAAQDQEDLLASVAYLDAKLRDAAQRSGASGEKLAMMTALNVTHEFLIFQRSDGFDMPGLKRRIDFMNARLDGVLAPQDKLF